jgi:predicted RNase H-like HicB family nuclease
MLQDEAGGFITECPSIPGCVSQGKTEEKTERNIEQAIRECLEVRAERGMRLSVSTREVKVRV